MYSNLQRLLNTFSLIVAGVAVFNIQSRRMADKVDKSDLKNRLTPIQYQVTQEKGTERPFSGKRRNCFLQYGKCTKNCLLSGCYNKFYEPGTYVCVVCNQPLFSSDQKYDSGCGWPAFNDVLDEGKVKLSLDTSGGMYDVIMFAKKTPNLKQFF